MMSKHPADVVERWTGLSTSYLFLALLLAIIVLKTVLLGLDFTPGFFQGDSQTYLDSAIYARFPSDRSFAYGLLLRYVALRAHSLSTLILFQTAGSAISAWIVAQILVRHFGVRFLLAAACAIACAVEPLQLISERYVLTEAVSTLLFAVYILWALEFVRFGKLGFLLLVQVVSVMLISIRVSFLLVLELNTIVLPLLSPTARRLWMYLLSKRREQVPAMMSTLRPLLSSVGASLLLAVLLSQTLLFGYRHLAGKMMKGPPAYLYADGFFLMGDWAPIIEPSDFPNYGLGRQVFSNLTHDPKDPRDRGFARWDKGGMVSNLCDTHLFTCSYADRGFCEERYNQIARKTAIHAALHHPVGLLKLAGFSLGEYFNREELKSTLASDEGFMQEDLYWPSFRKDLQQLLHFYRPELNVMSITKRWHRAAWPWYMFLILLPVLASIAFVLMRQYRRPGVLVLLSALWILTLQTIVLIERPTPRYLTASAWLSFLLLGFFAEVTITYFAGRRNARSTNEAPQLAAMGSHQL